MIKKKQSNTHSTNWKVAKVQEGPSMMHPISPLFCRNVQIILCETRAHKNSDTIQRG